MGYYLDLHIREEVIEGLRKGYKINVIISAHYHIVGEQIDVSELKGARKEKLREDKCLQKFSRET
jgi:hypothetical protein